MSSVSGGGNLRLQDELTGFAWSTTDDSVIFLTVVFVGLDAIPLLAAVVGVALAVVIDNEVIFFEPVTNNLLVAGLVNLIVEIGDLVDLVGVKGLLARLAKSTELGEPGPVVGLRHGGVELARYHIKRVCRCGSWSRLSAAVELVELASEWVVGGGWW